MSTGKSIHETNSAYWDTHGNDFLGAIVLPLYGAYISEKKCRLFGDVAGKRLLEIGCGNGRSLQYHGERGAADLWGVDLSAGQIAKAREHLAVCGIAATLACAPMEADSGLPTDYFDFVYSIYAIGWTTDLEGTFRRIASYLKAGGVFIFSWSHPIHKCVGPEADGFPFSKRYFDENWYPVALEEGSLTLSDRMLSTYINALVKAGFLIEQLIEENDEDLLAGQDGDFASRARQFPITFVIKARKR